MAVVHMRKNSLPTARQWFGDGNDDISRGMLRKYFYQHKLCSACCGFYGPNFDQPLCVTCHSFLHPWYINIPDVVVYRDKSDSDDSGNEEPTDFSETQEHRQARPPTARVIRPKQDKLLECITALISPKRKEIFEEGLMENLPNEVLTAIFSYLDDFSLWNCSQVCRRWNSIVDANVADDKWRQYAQNRWQLYKPSFIVPSWRTMYTKLAQSAPCILCLHQMTEQPIIRKVSKNRDELVWMLKEKKLRVNKRNRNGVMRRKYKLKVDPYIDYSSWRSKRLRNELKSLHSDPPEGIEAVPLDDLCFHWQASIAGPADSPYEGGTFFLYLQIPPSYPMKPPIVRFITKIFHPNISRHGDIGIDSIHDNWSLILTIPKILISIQSLLTDPYCHVCMEPEVGRLYQENRATFDAIARLWTMRFATLHKRPPILEKQSFLGQENGLNPNL